MMLPREVNGGQAPVRRGAANGSPGVIPGTTDHGGAVPVNGPKGKPATSLPDAGFEKRREEEGRKRQRSGRR